MGNEVSSIYSSVVLKPSVSDLLCTGVYVEQCLALAGYKGEFARTEIRRVKQNVEALSGDDQRLFPDGTGQVQYERLEKAAKTNATFLLHCLKHRELVLPKTEADQASKLADVLPTAGSVALRHPWARHLLQGLAREWASDMRVERDSCYAPLLARLRQKYENVSDKAAIRVLVPGSGFCRLASILADEGFSVCGVEADLGKLLAVCGACAETREDKAVEICPWAHDGCNRLSPDQNTAPVALDELASALKRDALSRLTVIPGDFDSEETQSRLRSQGPPFDCVVTCLFLDDGPSVLKRVLAVHRLLRSDGLWFDISSLSGRYHDGPYADPPPALSVSSVLSIDHRALVTAIRRAGFLIVEQQDNIKSYYLSNPRALMQNELSLRLFVAQKHHDVDQCWAEAERLKEDPHCLGVFTKPRDVADMAIDADGC